MQDIANPSQRLGQAKLDHRTRNMWLWIIGAVLAVVVFTGGFLRMNEIYKKTPMPAQINTPADGISPGEMNAAVNDRPDSTTEGTNSTNTGSSNDSGSGLEVYGSGAVQRSAVSPSPTSSPEVPTPKPM